MNPLFELFLKTISKEPLSEPQKEFLLHLFESVKEGHLCYETSDAPAFPSSLLEENAPLFSKKPLIKDENRYYLQHNWVIETHILNELTRLRKVSLDFRETFLEQTNLLESQKKAIKNALQNQLSVISGGPGTGKTFTAATLIHLYPQMFQNAKIVIAAPTGKAASHLHASLFKDGKEICSHIQAMTLHKLLKITPKDPQIFTPFQIDADLVVVDEASMIDVYVLAKLLASVRGETRLVLMGDPDQLPPVETGSLFKEIAELFGARLEKSMRVKDEILHLLASKINQGILPENLPLLPLNFDSFLIDTLYQKISPYLSFSPPDPDAIFKEFSSFRILNALRKGPYGVDAINQTLLQKMESELKENQFWALPILITANVKELDLYNGSFGILTGKSKKGSFCFVDAKAYFPQEIEYRRLPSFEISFCLSIHKSQGSEFQQVLALFPEGSEHFGKEALYTAITRAKEKIELTGKLETLKAMLHQKTPKTSGLFFRFSGLDILRNSS